MASVKEPVRLREKSLANGNKSLYLAIYVNGQRSYEFLRLYLIPAKTKADRDRNKETLALANSVKAQRILEIQNGTYGIRKARKDVRFYDFIENLVRTHQKGSSANRSIHHSCMNRLKDYDGRINLTFADITAEWVKGFYKYLDECDDNEDSKFGRLSPNSKRVYFGIFKSFLNKALSEGIIDKLPTHNVPCFAGEDSVREYLTIEELKRLASTECLYPEVGRAFLFSCLTGLRRSDIVKLTWGEVSTLAGRTRLIYRQKKTRSQEYLDITAQAAELLGERGDAGPDDLVFDSIYHPQRTIDILRGWAAMAGIDKNITFHSGRHTFAVMMLTLGTDIYTVSKLLGHHSLQTTQIYAKIVDAKKQEAVDNIPQIF